MTDDLVQRRLKYIQRQIALDKGVNVRFRDMRPQGTGPTNRHGMPRLPIDQHELIALCAPRPVFIGAGATQGDGWVDARGMFMAEVAAGPVYRLLGKKDLGTTEFPPIETPLMDGDLSFRQHNEGHVDWPNWPVFFKWADHYIKAPPLSATQSASAK